MFKNLAKIPRGSKEITTDVDRLTAHLLMTEFVGFLTTAFGDMWEELATTKELEAITERRDSIEKFVTGVADNDELLPKLFSAQRAKEALQNLSDHLQEVTFKDRDKYSLEKAFKNVESTIKKLEKTDDLAGLNYYEYFTTTWSKVMW